MSSTTRSFLLVVLIALLALCIPHSRVSADGSIQPFEDKFCNHATGNVTNVTLTATPASTCQRTTDSLGVPVAFTYSCNDTNFALSFWYNSSQCTILALPAWKVESSRVQDFCSLAQYTDAQNLLLFYARIQCTTYWADSSVVGDKKGMEAVTWSPFMALKQSVVHTTQHGLAALENGLSNPPPTKASTSFDRIQA